MIRLQTKSNDDGGMGRVYDTKGENQTTVPTTSVKPLIFTIGQPTMYIYNESNSTSTKSFVFVFIIIGLMLTISAIVATVAYVIKKEGKEVERLGTLSDKMQAKNLIKSGSKGDTRDGSGAIAGKTIPEGGTVAKAVGPTPKHSPASKTSSRSLTFINTLPYEGISSPPTFPRRQYHHQKCTRQSMVAAAPSSMRFNQNSPSSPHSLIPSIHPPRTKRGETKDRSGSQGGSTTKQIFNSTDRTVDNMSAYDPDDDSYFIANISPQINGWARTVPYYDTDSACGSSSLQSRTPLLYQLSGSRSGSCTSRSGGTPLTLPHYTGYVGEAVLKPNKKSRSESLKRKKRASAKLFHGGKQNTSAVLWGEDTKRAILERFDINNYVGGGSKDSDSEIGSLEVKSADLSRIANERYENDIISRYFQNKPTFSSKFPQLDKFEYL